MPAEAPGSGPCSRVRIQIEAEPARRLPEPIRQQSGNRIFADHVLVDNRRHAVRALVARLVPFFEKVAELV